MNLLEFMGNHPILTVILAYIIYSLILEVVRSISR